MNSAQMTTMLVEAICDEESFGLEAFFSDPRYASRNSTLSNLQSVLQKVKTDTRQSLEDTPTTELVADRSSNLKQIEALQETKEVEITPHIHSLLLPYPLLSSWRINC
jgi:hypothetical protein